MIKLPTFNEILQNAVYEFRSVFNDEPNIVAAAPGRVNLIGEHVDYCNGFVLPMALPYSTVIVGKKREGNNAQIVTCFNDVKEERKIKFETNNLRPGSPKWANYVKGVLHYYTRDYKGDYGFDAVINTNVPIGGGLSSSAALEVATLTFIEKLLGNYKELSQSEKALICQKAEHDFAGMPCGIMDQTISVMGKENHALLIDCESLETQQIPFNSDELAFLICNSNVRHELSASEYPTRRKQCAEALGLMGLKNYRDAKMENLKALENCDEILLRRARHVITEISRTSIAAEALKNGDFVKMGKLMTESHLSLRDDFEVSCNELDALVDATNKCSGVLGSRMTGGGFGGCTVTLVYKKDILNIIKNVTGIYKQKNYGYADFYVCEPSNGARIVQLKDYDF